MHFIENIIEPSRLLLAWQPSGNDYNTRFIVGELIRDALGEASLRYFPGTKDFENAKRYYFDGYLAYPNISKVHSNVLGSFLRRICSRRRRDFPEYLQGFRLLSNTHLSDFALLGYSGAKLLADGFSIIHPFDDVDGPCELLTEVAGFQRSVSSLCSKIQVGQMVSFSIEFNDALQEEIVLVKCEEQLIGCVNRGLKESFIDWMAKNRIGHAWVEKITLRPTVHLFVKIKST